ncbi:hypothetical protein L6452_15696 [Arctium lappa]|uniref:Uncharacterized protein n=1 Tax=Arctium lappa TaxID=4217 RepID=A0ACB9CPE1_ARCLA|nr:hypothetical protein L6452_15696 [Arctium lappa]
MEERKECDPMGSQSQHVHHPFYFVKFRPSYKLEKEEADEQYQLMTLAESRIKKEIDQRKADEHQIHRKLMWFSQCDEHIDWRKKEIKTLEASIGKVEPRLPIKSVPRTGFVCSTDHRDGQWDRRRCQKRLIKKDRMDMEYLVQVQEQLLPSKKSTGMTLCGTQELNHLIRLDEIEIIERNLTGRKRRVARLKSEMEFVRKNISCLQKELQDVTSKRLKAYERAYELGEQKKELVEGFMRQWNDSQAFRNDYERRKLLAKGSRDAV